MYMVMFVLDDSRHLDAVLEAWRDVGVRSVTLSETAGAHRRAQHRERVAARYAIGLIASDSEAGNYTLWGIVPDLAMAERCLRAAEDIVGDLDGPNTGVLAAWPLALTKGVPRPGADTG